MLASKVAWYRGQLAELLQQGDLEEMRNMTQDCDRFLRHHLPLSNGFDESLSDLVSELEQLLEVYQLAVNCVEQAKAHAARELQVLGRNRTNTHTYLDVARNLV